MRVAAASYLPRVAWTHAGSRTFGLVTRTRVASAVARELAARIFDFFTAWRAFFSVVGQWPQW